MIKPEELRIGNYILGIIEDDDDHVEESICRVISLDKIPISDYHIWVESYSGIDSPEYYDYFIGIPLTEQWLVDFGFKRGVDFWFNGDVILDISPEVLSYRFHYNIILHVHQLQNLYFALTGDELNGKEVDNG